MCCNDPQSSLFPGVVRRERFLFRADSMFRSSVVEDAAVLTVRDGISIVPWSYGHRRDCDSVSLVCFVGGDRDVRAGEGGVGNGERGSWLNVARMS